MRPSSGFGSTTSILIDIVNSVIIISGRDERERRERGERQREREREEKEERERIIGSFGAHHSDIELSS